MKPSRAHESLGDSFYDRVAPATFPELTLRYRNQRAAASVGLDMLSEITKAQLVAYRLAQLKAASQATPQQISLAKMNNVEMALDVARTARDILGAAGILDDYQCSGTWKTSKACGPTKAHTTCTPSSWAAPRRASPRSPTDRPAHREPAKTPPLRCFCLVALVHHALTAINFIVNTP